MQWLDHAGWEYATLPRGSADRAALMYRVGTGDPLIWYSAGTTVDSNYLRALLDADKLLNDYAIGAIPHSATPDIYSCILRGIQPPPMVQLEDDVDAPPFAVEYGDATEGGDDHDEGDDDDDDANDDDGAKGGKGHRRRVVKRRRIHEAPPPGVEDPPDYSPTSPGSEDPPGGGGGAVEHPPTAPVDPEGEQVVEDDAEDDPADKRIINFEWWPPGTNPFQIKQATATSWQATCPYHFKSRVPMTKCKKTLSAVGTNAATIVRRLQYWCTQCDQFTHQRDHRGFTPTAEDCPEPEFVEALAQSFEAPIAADIVADVALDELSELI